VDFCRLFWHEKTALWQAVAMYYPAINALGPENTKIKLFYQTSADMQKEHSLVF
jgi:hypothetical protein